jgi:hypothetical protein
MAREGADRRRSSAPGRDIFYSNARAILAYSTTMISFSSSAANQRGKSIALRKGSIHDIGQGAARARSVPDGRARGKMQY